jgi:hypothetical protein
MEKLILRRMLHAKTAFRRTSGAKFDKHPKTPLAELLMTQTRGWACWPVSGSSCSPEVGKPDLAIWIAEQQSIG